MKLLIVLNGIETQHDIFHCTFHFLLIVLNGIETWIEVVESAYVCLLIVLNGIETGVLPQAQFGETSFNRTKWNWNELSSGRLKQYQTF